LMRAIRNRRDLLLRVLEIVAETQKEALTEGLDKLKPLSLKETAQKAGIHESTISRIVMNKYVQTPIGIFPLRQFFSTSFKTKDGEDVSSQSIRLKIKEIIDNEDKNRPLRDQDIAGALKKTQQIEIARRTVAKYRKALGIPSVPQRRKNTFPAKD
ncbi:MAG: RNA polymerase sigma-54 factor, partial [Candidatus Omnitrophica bacterium]|nr:RNA polymerase sigma-54 factor [Candidatus Omnitrophota bacterium]